MYHFHITGRVESNNIGRTFFLGLFISAHTDIFLPSSNVTQDAILISFDKLHTSADVAIKIHNLDRIRGGKSKPKIFFMCKIYHDL